MKVIVLASLILMAANSVCSGFAQEPPLPSAADRQELVNDLEDRIEEWVEVNDDESDIWVGNRARLEMQLAVARLELATLMLLEARTLGPNDNKKLQMQETLKLVQHADRTLYAVDIERLDDVDRRSYRGLSAMRHRVTSLQVGMLLEMLGEGYSNSEAAGSSGSGTNDLPVEETADDHHSESKLPPSCGCCQRTSTRCSHSNCSRRFRRGHHRHSCWGLFK